MIDILILSGVVGISMYLIFEKWFYKISKKWCKFCTNFWLSVLALCAYYSISPFVIEQALIIFPIACIAYIFYFFFKTIN